MYWSHLNVSQPFHGEHFNPTVIHTEIDVEQQSDTRNQTEDEHPCQSPDWTPVFHDDGTLRQ